MAKHLAVSGIARCVLVTAALLTASQPALADPTTLGHELIKGIPKFGEQ